MTAEVFLHVEAFSGHYSYPGNSGNGEPLRTAPVPHPSNVRGFLENLCALSPQTLEGSLAYGVVREPTGHGLLARRAQVEMSGLKGYTLDNKRVRALEPGEKSTAAQGLMGAAVRLQLVETLFFPVYLVAYRGPFAAKLRASLEGKVNTWGVTYLGASDGAILDLHEVSPTAEARWLVPGETLRLIWKSKRGYDVVNPNYRTYDLTERQVIQEAAWHSL